MTDVPGVLELRRGGDRFRTVAPGVDSRHCFSYGAHYDPDNLGFGVLMAHNEDRLAPGAGFERHPHRGLDIVTWVLSGTLEHEHWAHSDGRTFGRQSTGPERLSAGTAQVLRTGTGVNHAEHAAAEHAATEHTAADPPAPSGAHYVQMWVTSAEPRTAAAYERRDFTAELSAAAAGVRGVTRAVTVASGRSGRSPGSALSLSQPGAELSVARLPAGAKLELPAAALAHVFIARGAVTIEPGTHLAAGDSLRLTGAPALTVHAVQASEILIWALSH